MILQLSPKLSTGKFNNMKTRSLKSKRSQGFLTENVVFIIIAVAFIAILFVFLYRISSTTRMIEEGTAKKLALMLDSAKPGTTIEMNINNLLEQKETTIGELDMISITGNIITVKLKEDSGYSYGFFNNISVQRKINTLADGTKFLELTISR
jgi:hypothetical protein